MPSDRDAIAEAIRVAWVDADDACRSGVSDEELADAVLPFVAQARAEGYQAAISDARKAVEALPQTFEDSNDQPRTPLRWMVVRTAVLAVFDKLPQPEAEYPRCAVCEKPVDHRDMRRAVMVHADGTPMCESTDAPESEEP